MAQQWFSERELLNPAEMSPGSAEPRHSGDVDPGTHIPDHSFDGGNLDCGSGLILLIRQSMEKVPQGGLLELRSAEPTVALELPPWCRMTGHVYLSAVEDGPGRWRHFLRRGGNIAAQERSLAEDKAGAQSYEWRVRARSTGALESKVYVRNFGFTAGQPASFEEKDKHPSALEYMLGAVAAEIVTGFASACSRHTLVVDDLEASLKAKLHNVLAHLGLEEGDPSVASIEITVFVTSPEAGERLRGVFAGMLRCAPLWQTLKKSCAITARLAVQ